MWDTQLGRLLTILETRGVADHTTVLLTSDNGPHQCLERTDSVYGSKLLSKRAV